MSLYVTLVRVLIALNVLLLLGLASVWGRNYLELRSKHSLGLLVFALFLLGENVMAGFFFVFHPTLTAWYTNPELVPPIAQGAMLLLRTLEFGGLVFLTWITMD